MEFELIIKYFNGRATPEEAMAIDEWCDASTDNREYFDELHRSWQETQDHSLTITDTAIAWQQLNRDIKPKTYTLPNNSRRLKISAAAALIFILIGLGIWKLTNTPISSEQFTTVKATSTEKKFLLPDSSRVSLSAGSYARYKDEPGNRTLFFSGSGTFHIRHDEQHPWLIHLDGFTIRDIGTVFDIQQKADSIIVTLTEGQVELSSLKDTILLSEGEYGGFIRRDSSLFRNQQILRSSFTFEDAALPEVAAMFEKSYHVQVILKDEQLKDMRLTASIKNLTLTEALNVVASTFGISYKIINSNVYLTGPNH